jgi:hypothetical protein
MLRRNMSQELLGKYTRLKAELMAAYASPTCHSGLIERISADLVELTQRFGQPPTDEQGGDVSIPGNLPAIEPRGSAVG